MKNIRILLAAAAVAFTAILPLRAEEADKAALDSFKKEMAGIEAYTKEQEAAIKENPMAGITMIRSIVVKVKAVKTDGLPADFKEAYGKFSAVLSKMGDMFKDWPEKPADMQAFIVKKSTEDPKFMEDFGGKMTAIEAEMAPVIAKLDELGKKYGIESLGNLAPGK